MLESAWLFIGVLGVLITGAAVWTNDDGIAIIAGVLGFVTWGVWTFGSFEVVVVGDSSTFTFTMPEVTILGVAFALVPAYIALTGPVEIVDRWRNPKQKDI